MSRSRLVKENGPLPIPRAANVAIQLLEDMGYARQQGFVRRHVNYFGRASRLNRVPTEPRPD